MQLGNWAHMGNIVGMDHTSTKWLRQEQGHSRSRVMRNTVLHSREQSLKPHQATRAQDPKPFVWTKSANDIIRKVNRGRAALKMPPLSRHA
jgi:hypothetical protein